MLLTLAKPPKPAFDFKIHDYSPTFSSSSTTARFSPKLQISTNGHLPPQRRDSPPSTMGTPHRGLPPPSAMALPDPGRAPPPPISSSLGALPAAPSQWQGAEDGMKNWLAAKAEEEKRKQEEEKTRQENLKLEQRKIEIRMLETSIQGGIPPHLVPIIFAGIGGGNLANISAEWIQSYQSTLQASQQQQQAHTHAQSQEHRRDSRLIGQPPPGPFAAQPQTPQSVLPPTSVLPGQPLPSQPQQSTFSASYSSGNMSPRSRGAAAQPGHVGAPTSAPRPPPPQSQLPRLTTNEIHVQQTPTAASSVQMPNTQSGQQEQTSPSIYFHHWVPPTSQQDKATSSANPPATPSGKYRASPSTLARQRATSHASDPDYTSSPKKRKAQGSHQAPPPPTSAPQSHTSPSFSHVSTSSASTPGRRGHTRTRSDISSRGDGHVSSVSRRTTVSSQTHPDVGAAQSRDGPEHLRYQPQPRGREEIPSQQSEAGYVPAGPRNEGRHHEHQQPQAVFHADPRSFGPQQQHQQQHQHQQQQQQQQQQQHTHPHQQHHDRGTAPFPKWESGDQ
ncbi:hypothetical protein DM02DRAFT_655726 [Periconia macrospinosa]|uniref:Uncharacterized protein n=1 Tax=Periconia macrospinosa TaxID=97972 RepID=A0A2V1DPB7_9PLEO|nr:hypothetical protein DM02DRAFT_655726 [Periconia macrospinosa]